MDIDAWRNKVRLITAGRGYADLLRKPACSPVSWVPHRGQNDRSDFAVELNRVAWPLVMRNSIDLTLIMLTNGTPVVRPTFPVATASRAAGVASFRTSLWAMYRSAQGGKGRLDRHDAPAHGAAGEPGAREPRPRGDG